jgi:hypothetical protein
MIKPVSSIDPTIYSTGTPINPKYTKEHKNPREYDYTEEDLEDFIEPYWNRRRKVLGGVFATILGVTLFYICQPVFLNPTSS